LSLIIFSEILLLQSRPWFLVPSAMYFVTEVRSLSFSVVNPLVIVASVLFSFSSLAFYSLTVKLT
jgi:hypothetical protein